jgi:hypothetical protein
MSNLKDASPSLRKGKAGIPTSIIRLVIVLDDKPRL